MKRVVDQTSLVKKISAYLNKQGAEFDVRTYDDSDKKVLLVYPTEEDIRLISMNERSGLVKKLQSAHDGLGNFQRGSPEFQKYSKGRRIYEDCYHLGMHVVESFLFKGDDGKEVYIAFREKGEYTNANLEAAIQNEIRESVEKGREEARKFRNRGGRIHPNPGQRYTT